MAQTCGGVTLTGAPVSLGSQNTIFKGFDLQNTLSSGDYVSITGAGSQFTQNKVHFVNGTGEQKWIYSKANNVTIDYNEIFGKTTVNDVILVGGGTLRSGNRILWNHIHDIVDATGDTESEVIRFGESSAVYLDFAGEIACNRIEGIDSDDEYISIKCTNVNIHDNTIIGPTAGEAPGSIVLRQARFSKVNRNILINSGIRFYGEGHEITRNEIIDNDVNGGSVNMAMFIGSGDREEIPTVNGGSIPGTPGQSVALNAHYARVKNCTIANNIIENGNLTTGNKVSFGTDSGSSFQPTGNIFRGNIIVASTGTLADAVSGASWTANTVDNNILNASGTAVVGDMPTSGYTTQAHNLTQDANGVYRCCFFLKPENVGPFAKSY